MLDPPVYIIARPSTTPIMPSVATTEGMRRWFTSSPLASPIAAPTATAIASPTSGWAPSTMRAAARQPARASTAPNEMSSSPRIATIVVPIPMIAKIAAWRSRISTFDSVRNVSVAIARYTAQRRKITMNPSRAKNSVILAFRTFLSDAPGPAGITATSPVLMSAHPRVVRAGPRRSPRRARRSRAPRHRRAVGRSVAAGRPRSSRLRGCRRAPNARRLRPTTAP